MIQNGNLGCFSQEELNSKVEYTFDYLSVYNARYDECPYYADMKPLDGRLLNEMARYEPEVLKMEERVNMAYDSGENRFLSYHNHLRYWNTFLDEAKIDACFWFSKPHDIFDYIIYRLCQLKKICFVMQEILPFQSCYGCNYQTDYERFDDKIEKSLKKRDDSPILSEAMTQEYQLMTGARETVAPIIGVGKTGLIKQRFRDVRYLAKYDIKHFVKKVPFHIRERIRVKSMINEYEKLAVVPDLTKPYIFFALHYQPEMTTSPTGGWFVHQYLAVEMLSYHVPQGVEIYVKEHPVIRIQKRTTTRIEHYRRMNKLKNVSLVKLSVSGEELAKHAVAVSAVSGSIGYWAMYNLKPYIMFGNLAMKYAPGTFNIRNNEDCAAAMKALFEDDFSFSHMDVKKFIDVLESESVTLEYNPFNAESNDCKRRDVQNVASKIIELIKAQNI